ECVLLSGGGRFFPASLERYFLGDRTEPGERKPESRSHARAESSAKTHDKRYTERGRRHRPAYLSDGEQAVIDLFREVLRGNRIALFFDDIQWLDAMSFQLLNR